MVLLISSSPRWHCYGMLDGSVYKRSGNALLRGRKPCDRKVLMLHLDDITFGEGGRTLCHLLSKLSMMQQDNEHVRGRHTDVTEYGFPIRSLQLSWLLDVGLKIPQFAKNQGEMNLQRQDTIHCIQRAGPHCLKEYFAGS